MCCTWGQTSAYPSTETFEQLHELKESRGDTWDQLLVHLHESEQEDTDTENVQLGAGYQEIAEKIGAAMDTEQIDEKTLAEYVADYLVAEADLPRKVAEEVTGR